MQLSSASRLALVLTRCSQLEALMSSASWGHQLTQLMGLRASRRTHGPTAPAALVLPEGDGGSEGTCRVTQCLA